MMVFLGKRGIHVTQVITIFGVERQGQLAEAPVLLPYATSTSDGSGFQSLDKLAGFRR